VQSYARRTLTCETPSKKYVEVRASGFAELRCLRPGTGIARGCSPAPVSPHSPRNSYWWVNQTPKWVRDPQRPVEMHLPVLQTTAELNSLRFSRDSAEKHELIHHRHPRTLLRPAAGIWHLPGPAATRQGEQCLQQCY